MLFLGMGTAFAQDMPGFGGGTLELSQPTLNPASGVVKPGTTIEGTFSDETIQSIMSASQGAMAFVLYVVNDEATQLETSMDVLGYLMSQLMGGGEDELAILEDDDDAPSYAYQVAAYGMDPESDPDDADDMQAYMKWYKPITIPEDAAGGLKFRLRVAAMSQMGEVVYSDEFTADYTTLPQLSLSPITLEGEVGKGVMSSFTIDGGIVNPYSGAALAVEVLYPVAVYYTTDGVTVPSKETYEAQTDKENGVIKKVESETEDGEIVYPENGKFLPIAFDEACTLKAIGYYTEDDEEVVTALFEQQIKVKAAATPVFDPADATAFVVDDKLVIKNPDPAPGEDEEGYWDYNEDYGTRLYFSFDGTMPSADGYYMQDEYSIFRSQAGQDIEMAFGQDAKGFYVYVPEIMGYVSGYDTIRLPENGQFTFKVVAVSYMATGKEIQGFFGTQPEMMPYGSVIVEKVYTVSDLTLPELVMAPTFVPAAGEVEKGTEVTWTWSEEYDYDVMGVVYVANGTDADLDIDAAGLMELISAWQDEEEDMVREDGVAYLYYEDAGAYRIEKNVTLKARLVLGTIKEDAEEDEPGMEIALSPVVTAAYTVKGETPTEPVVEPVAAPTFSVKSGEVEKGTKVEIACETEGAVIYYTVDGAEPTAESTEYKEAIEITGKVTIKAIAIKGELKSEVVEATYELLANEDEELAGVSVYPNPSNGLFNIKLPVAVTIEVFASNGVLTQRVNAAAGVFTLTLDRSGIYFLRITGEGRTAIKRIIVR